MSEPKQRGEFERIELFKRPFRVADRSVVAGPGDDCALTRSRPGLLLVSKVDQLVEGVHFSRAFRPEEIGHKALAVALSDLAAAAAIPRWILVALALPPDIDDRFLAGLARGMSALANSSSVSLIGGNLSRGGELSITVTALGEVRPELALRRSGALPGHELLITGTLGDAALGLRLLAGGRPSVRSSAVRAQLMPTPRLEVGKIAGRYASAGIDVSDGLLQDLGHLCERSGVGAELLAGAIPRSKSLRAMGAQGLELALTGGEDYELLFAVPPSRASSFIRAAARRGTSLSRIGRLEAGAGVRLVDEAGRALPLPGNGGWDHFGRAPSPAKRPPPRRR